MSYVHCERCNTKLSKDLVVHCPICIDIIHGVTRCKSQRILVSGVLEGKTPDEITTNIKLVTDTLLALLNSVKKMTKQYEQVRKKIMKSEEKLRRVNQELKEKEARLINTKQKYWDIINTYDM